MPVLAWIGVAVALNIVFHFSEMEDATFLAVSAALFAWIVVVFFGLWKKLPARVKAWGVKDEGGRFESEWLNLPYASLVLLGLAGIAWFSGEHHLWGYWVVFIIGWLIGKARGRNEKDRDQWM